MMMAIGARMQAILLDNPDDRPNRVAGSDIRYENSRAMAKRMSNPPHWWERPLLIKAWQGVRNGLSCLGAARQAFLEHDPVPNNKVNAERLPIFGKRSRSSERMTGNSDSTPDLPQSMIRKSGNRFSEKIMLKQRDEIMMRFHLITS
jgi:hypothetical protein